MNRRIRASDINPAMLAAAGESVVPLSKAKQIAQKFADQVRAAGLPEPERELRFAEIAIGRRWAFDFAWPAQKIAVEIEGLVVFRGADGELQVKGRHASITGFKEDCEKYAWAAVLGWRVLRFEQSQVKAKIAIEFVQRIFAPPMRAELPPKQQGFELPQAMAAKPF